MTQLDQVKKFWNAQSCGERHAIGDSELDRFMAEDAMRYELEPYIEDFACFSEFRNLDVLEIGVGFGADHIKIASNKPKSLTGIDLTERAIENTTARIHLFGLQSELKTDNAENLSFDNESFDAVYSWGVLHHSPNTEKCFEEVFRVLRPGGFAKIMIYHKYSPVGLMLWIRYGLLKLKPLIGLENIYAQYLESPGTKAYTIEGARRLAKKFSSFDVKIELGSGDLLEGDAGARHKGFLLSFVRLLYPRFIVRGFAKLFPVGLFMLITVRK